MEFAAILVCTWLLIAVAFVVGYIYALWSHNRNDHTADIVMKAVVHATDAPVDFRVDQAFIENAPMGFLLERGQTREQFAEQVSHAIDEVRAEGHTSPPAAMESFARKIGVEITNVSVADPEEAKRVTEAQKDFAKRAN